MADRRMRQADREGGNGPSITAATAPAPAPAVGGGCAGGGGGGGGGGNATTHTAGGNSSIKVAVRVRPLTEHECTLGRPSATLVTDSTRGLVAIRSTDGTDQPKVFQFDKVFDQTASQREVFEAVARPVVDKALQGFNGAIIAYGQTGTGKTYTMEGDLMGDDEQMGIIPGVCRHIFEATAGTRSSVHVNYIEIYNEDLRDLLSERRDCIALRELAGGRLILGRDYKVESLDDITHLLQRGKANRAVAVTRNNESSSRSHAVFMLHYASTCAPPTSAGGKGNGGSREANGGGGNAAPGHRGPARVVRSTLQLVDLAGSERLESQARNTEGTRLRESRKINKSLTALGLVISALAERKRHVPYRDSKLTRLLQDSLGGNSHTVLIATVSPAEAHRKETMCTLRYATGAKDVTNVVVRNESEMRLAAAAAAAAAATFDAGACVAWPNALDQFWTPSGGGGAGPTHRGNSGRGWGRLARRGASAKAMSRAVGRTSGRVGGRASFPGGGAADPGVFERWWDPKRARDNGRTSNRTSAVQASALRIVFTGGGVSSPGEGKAKAGGVRSSAAGVAAGGRRTYAPGRSGGVPAVSKGEGRARDKDKCVESVFSSDLESLPFSVTSISARQLSRRSTTSRRTQTCSLYTGLEVPPPNTPQHCCVCLHPPQSAPAGWPPWLRLAPGSHGVARAAKLAVSLPALPLPDDLPHVKWEKSAIGDCSSLEGLESASTNVQGSEHSYLSRSIVYLDGTSDSAGCASPALLITPLSTPRDSGPSSPPPVHSFPRCRLPAAFHDVRCSMTCSLHCRRGRRRNHADGDVRGRKATEGDGVAHRDPQRRSVDRRGGDVAEDKQRQARTADELQVRRAKGNEDARAETTDINCFHSQDEGEDEDDIEAIDNCDRCSVEDDGQVSYTQGTVISVVTTHRGSIAGADVEDREENTRSPVERIRHRSVSEGAKENQRLHDVGAESAANKNSACVMGMAVKGGDGDKSRPAEATQRCQSFASFSSTRWSSGGDADNHRSRPPESWRRFSVNSRPSMPSQSVSTTSWRFLPTHPPFNHSPLAAGAGNKGNTLGGRSNFTNSHPPAGPGVLPTPSYTAFFPGNGAAGHHTQQLETLDYVKKGVFKGLEDLESEVKCMYRNLNRRCMSMHSRPPAPGGVCVSNSACEFPSAKERPHNFVGATGIGAKFSTLPTTAHPSRGPHWWDRSGTEILKTTNSYRQANPRKEAIPQQTMGNAIPAGSNPLPARPSFPSQNPYYPPHPQYFRPLRRSLTQYT